MSKERLSLQVSALQFQDFMNAVRKELYHAQSKHPNWPSDIIHGASIVSEESGELTKAVVQFVYENGDPQKIIDEVIHTATMCLRYWVALTGFWVRKVKNE